MDRLRFGFFNELKSDTPTLLFFGSGHALRALIDVLLFLQDKDVVRLDQDSHFISLGGTEVAISLTEESRGVVSCLIPGRYGFKWLVPKNDLNAFIKKIEPVAISSQPCHQYLDGQLGDITVMVSKGEYPDTLYPDPPQSLPARFQYFRERAGLSMQDVAKKMQRGMSFTDMCVWDIEAYDDELFSVYSARDVSVLTQILGITLQELINLDTSEPPITPSELAQLTNTECITRGITLDEFEDIVGWRLSKMMQPPELLLQDMSIEGIIDLCKEIHVDWVRVIIGISSEPSVDKKIIP